MFVEFIKVHINQSSYESLSSIFDLKNVKNTHGGVIILVKLHAEACNFTKNNMSISGFLSYTNGTKSR